MALLGHLRGASVEPRQWHLGCQRFTGGRRFRTRSDALGRSTPMFVGWLVGVCVYINMCEVIGVNHEVVHGGQECCCRLTFRDVGMLRDQLCEKRLEPECSFLRGRESSPVPVPLRTDMT